MPSTWETLKEKKEARAKIVADMSKIVAEKRSLTAEEDTNFNKMSSDAESIKAEIGRLEKLYDLEKDIAGASSETRSLIGRENAETAKDTEEKSEKRSKQAFNSFLRSGLGAISSEQRSFLRNGDNEPELRSLTVGGIGVVGTREFATQLFDSLKNYSGPLDAGAFVFNRTDGNPFTIPTSDDTGNTGETTAEGAAISSSISDPTVGNVVLAPVKYDSGWIKLSLELLQDNAFNAEEYIWTKAGQRCGRKFNTAATAIVAASTVGATAASPTTLTYDDLINFIYSLNSAYRKNTQNVAIELSDVTLAAIRKIKDSQGRPILQANGNALDPLGNTILGLKYVINDDLASPAAGNVVAAIADHSKAFAVANVVNPYLIRASEIFIANGLVGFNVFQRMDFKATDTHAVRTLKMAAS